MSSSEQNGLCGPAPAYNAHPSLESHQGVDKKSNDSIVLKVTSKYINSLKTTEPLSIDTLIIDSHLFSLSYYKSLQVKHLKFSDDLFIRKNYSISSFPFPLNLQSIHFGESFNKPIYNIMFPETLQKVYFSSKFNQPIHEDVFKSSIKEIWLHQYYDYAIPEQYQEKVILYMTDSEYWEHCFFIKECTNHIDKSYYV
jgi:hypothetical protein